LAGHGNSEYGALTGEKSICVHIGSLEYESVLLPGLGVDFRPVTTDDQYIYKEANSNMQLLTFR
jgi:hypothetical protein